MSYQCCGPSSFDDFAFANLLVCVPIAARQATRLKAALKHQSEQRLQAETRAVSLEEELQTMTLERCRVPVARGVAPGSHTHECARWLPRNTNRDTAQRSLKRSIAAHAKESSATRQQLEVRNGVL